MSTKNISELDFYKIEIELLKRKNELSTYKRKKLEEKEHLFFNQKTQETYTNTKI